MPLCFIFSVICDASGPQQRPDDSRLRADGPHQACGEAWRGRRGYHRGLASDLQRVDEPRASGSKKKKFRIRKLTIEKWLGERASSSTVVLLAGAYSRLGTITSEPLLSFLCSHITESART